MLVICPTCSHRVWFSDRTGGGTFVCERCGERVRLVGTSRQVVGPPGRPWHAADFALAAACAGLALFCVWFSVSRLGSDGLPFLFWTALFVSLSAAPVSVGWRMGRGRPGGEFGGMLLGLFLSWPGLAVLLFLPSEAGKPVCPDCAEPVRPEARVCRHCGRRLSP